VVHSICLQIWKTQQWPQDWKRSIFIPIPQKGNAKECSNYCTNALIANWALGQPGPAVFPRVARNQDFKIKFLDLFKIYF